MIREPEIIQTRVPIAANQCCSFPAPPTYFEAFFRGDHVREREKSGQLMVINRDLLERLLQIQKTRRSVPDVSEAIEQILSLNSSEYFVSSRIVDGDRIRMLIIGFFFTLYFALIVFVSWDSGSLKILPFFYTLVIVDRYLSGEGGYLRGHLSGLFFADCLARFGIAYSNYANSTGSREMDMTQLFAALAAYLATRCLEEGSKGSWLCRKLLAI